jgi:hypothetical protein
LNKLRLSRLGRSPVASRRRRCIVRVHATMRARHLSSAALLRRLARIYGRAQRWKRRLSRMREIASQGEVVADERDCLIGGWSNPGGNLL